MIVVGDARQIGVSDKDPLAGTRRIQISDELANMISKRLHDIVAYNLLWKNSKGRIFLAQI